MLIPKLSGEDLLCFLFEAFPIYTQSRLRRNTKAYPVEKQIIVPREQKQDIKQICTKRRQNPRLLDFFLVSLDVRLVAFGVEVFQHNILADFAPDIASTRGKFTL